MGYTPFFEKILDYIDDYMDLIDAIEPESVKHDK